MKIINTIENIPQIIDSILTIGSFDGMHRGHQEIIKKVVAASQSQNCESVVITFDPHPRHVLDANQKLPILISLEKKLSILKDLHVSNVLVIPFTVEFSRIDANVFMNVLVVKNFNPLQIIIGPDHHFGFQRKGSPEFLMEYCRNNHIKCEIVEAVTDDKIKFSSSHIRNLLKEGFVRRASFELGWVYGFKAKVVRGSGRGKGLTFPTANFIAVEENQLFPKHGVYFCRGRINGNTLYGMCNLGVRPTFNEEHFVAEIHFFSDEIKELYEQIIEIEFLERIRDEKKFDSATLLVDQLKIDQEHCQQLMKKYL